MKSFNEIVFSEPYFSGFVDAEDVIDQFHGGCEPNVPKDIRILFAHYEHEGWGHGSAFVLFTQDGEFFEVNGSHCSCWGLAGCWSPEAVTIEALIHRLENGTFPSYLGDSAQKLADMLGATLGSKYED